MQVIKHILENKVLQTILLAVLVTALSVQNLLFYLNPNTSLFVFLLMSPFLFTINKNQKRLRFVWISLALIILYFFFKLQILFFLSFSTFILFLIESNIGKVNYLPLFIILLISPYSYFIFNVFGFPARLLITDAATVILSVVLDDVSNNGNNIIINNQLFSVDPECMGLKMVGYAYATTLLFISFFEKKFIKKLSFLKVIGILTLGSIFIILVNLFRIVLIVILQAKPATASHELIGILCFGCYFILPMYFITKWIIQRDKNKPIVSTKKRSVNQTLSLVMTFGLIATMAYLNFNRDNYRNNDSDQKSNKIKLANFNKTITENNVVKFKNDNALIYIKPSCHVLGPDHSPTICWRGSGYEFINIKTEKHNNYTIYTAQLKKDEEILQTAWWFDNGKDKTISQLDWRWKTATGNEPYRLINITTTNQQELKNQVERLIKKNLF